MIQHKLILSLLLYLSRFKMRDFRRFDFCRCRTFETQIIAILLASFKRSTAAKSKSIKIAFWSVTGIYLSRFKMRDFKQLAFAMGILILLLPIYSFGLSTDQNKKLHIRSKTANINRTTGVGVFIGNVIIDQGTTHVTGDKVITHNDKNNKLKEVIIIGLHNHFAHYKTLTELKKPPLYATARRIQYFPQQHYVILIKDANIIQGEDKIDGQHLEYDMTKQVLNSTAITTQKGNSSRTTIVIQPDGSTSTSTNSGAS